MLERGRVGRALAQRALGLAAAADAELDDPPAGVRLRRARPGRLHDRRRGRRRSSTATPRRSTRRCASTPPSGVSPPCGDLFVVETDDGPFRARNVVIATGWCDRPAIPAMAGHVSTGIHQVAPSDYRQPGRPARPVACSSSAPRRPACSSPTSSMLSGRPVTLAVGTPQPDAAHLPRHGLVLVARPDRRRSTARSTTSTIPSRPAPSRRCSSSARPIDRTLDLATLQTMGVRLVGRLIGHRRHAATFAPDVDATVDVAERPHATACSTASTHAVDRLGADARGARPRSARPRVADLPPRHARPRTRPGITHDRVGDRLPPSATSGCELPILDERGEIAQYRGVTPMPGAYVLGQRFQHHRNSNFIDGVGRDAPVRRRAHLSPLTPSPRALRRRPLPRPEMSSAHDTVRLITDPPERRLATT